MNVDNLEYDARLTQAEYAEQQRNFMVRIAICKAFITGVAVALVAVHVWNNV